MQRHLVYFFTTSGSVRRRGAEEKRQGREPKLLQEGVPTQEECFFSPFIRFWSVRSVWCAFFRSGSFFRRSVQCIIRRRHFLNTSNSRVACSRIQVACDCSAFEFSRHSGFFSPFQRRGEDIRLCSSHVRVHQVHCAESVSMLVNGERILKSMVLNLNQQKFSDELRSTRHSTRGLA